LSETGRNDRASARITRNAADSIASITIVS
jgi:hypothetical protein